MTFKPGDRVVTINSINLSKEQTRLVGKSSIIIEWDGKYWKTTDKTTGYHDWEIIPEEIYNSPLYKVLQED